MAALKRVNITANELENLLASATVIRRDRRNGVKVALDEKNQCIIKTFDLSRKSKMRRKPLFSVAGNFIKNATQLRKKGISTIQPSIWLWCKENHYEVVTYPLLPGTDIYATLRKDKDASVLKLLAKYIADLHAKNIYFRAGHSENYLLQDENQLAIIDIDNLRFSINLRRRGKNLAYLYWHSQVNYPECFAEYTFHDFLKDYFAAAKLGKLREKIMLYWMKNALLKRNINFS